MTAQAYNPQTEELYRIAGDEEDPDGTGIVGASSTMRLVRTAICHPLIRYRGQYGDVVLEADVYKEPGAEKIWVNLLCPRCRHSLKIDQDNKKIHLELGPEVPPTQRRRGTISIEPFQCPWELDDEAQRMEFAVGLCQCKLGIDQNIARDA